MKKCCELAVNEFTGLRNARTQIAHAAFFLRLKGAWRRDAGKARWGEVVSPAALWGHIVLNNPVQDRFRTWRRMGYNKSA